MKNLSVLALTAALAMAACSDGTQPQNQPAARAAQGEAMQLVQEWDKTFPQNDKVSHRKVTFTNTFGITLAADLYEPKEASGKLAALAVAGPYGAVKEQVSGRYAQEMAARGFLTIAFDPSYTGESGGEPRHVNSPDINTEDFQAAVDFLSVQENVDPEKIGIIGICGWGGFALNVAALDTRIKATVTSTMYDMARVTTNGYFDADNSPEARKALRTSLGRQRTEAFKTGKRTRSGGVMDPVPEDAPQFVKDYNSFYKTPRGYHKRAPGSTDGWVSTGAMALLNTRLLQFSDEIESPVLMLHGEKAHSRYFSEGAFAKLKGENKELYIVPGASHVDLYDQMDVIPFDKIEAFFKKHLQV